MKKYLFDLPPRDPARKPYAAGLTPEATRHAGELFFSTKEEGLGIGLLLANAALERLGGRVSLRRDPRGETCTRIDLPAHAGARG